MWQSFIVSRHIQRAINCYDSGITPVKIYDISQLKAMQLATIAWDEVTLETIGNCWYKTRILPSSLLDHSCFPSSKNSITVADMVVGKDLDDLENREAIQEQNWVDFEEFVEPIGEQEDLGDGETNREIFDAVMKAWEACKMMEINRGDDDDEADVEHLPALKELLCLSATVQKFISTIDKPFACKLELFLGQLGHHAWVEYSKTHQDTHMTDFFSYTQPDL